MAKIAINIATGTLQKEEIIVGIDLGTTNSLIAMVHPDTQEVMVLKDIDQQTLVPSVIHIAENGECLVGEAARPFLTSDPNRTVYSVKRLMGKSFQDISSKAGHIGYKLLPEQGDSLVKVKIGDATFTPVELSAKILGTLKSRAEHVLKMPVQKCVITVPAYFNDAQRQATRDAGKLAGLEVLRIINEPTAASLAYGLGLTNEEHKLIAVYDLGGGTFDVSILRLEQGIFEVLSTHGDTYLGGDDFDQSLVKYFGEQIEKGEGGHYEKDDQALRLLAEQAKRVLSEQEEFRQNWNGHHLSINRAEFEKLIEPLVSRTLASCHQALQDARLQPQAIDVVVMVGGSTRVPLVRRRVGEFFGQDVFDKLNPDEVVARGAAIQADILAGNNRNLLLLDITPLSLGIETMGGLMDVLIPRNSKIPVKASRQYTTQKDGQSGIDVSVYQGERDKVSDNRKLGEFKLSGIPAMPAGLPKVEIQFMINADGILQVQAKELRSGVQAGIELKPQYGLSDAEVERMLQDSLTHAAEDIQERALIETKTEAAHLIQLTENFLTRHKSHLTETEWASTKGAITELEQELQGDDKERIQQSIEALNQISRPYAERVMDLAVAAALKGSSI